MYSHRALACPKPAFAPAFEARAVTTSVLDEDSKVEVLEFLDRRPLHTVMLSGLIRDNGVVNCLNRGELYGCRNPQGELEGVGLIGHATLIETSTDRALQAFAELARKCSSTHMIMGEDQHLEDFWAYYFDDGRKMHRICRELLLELRWPIEVKAAVPGLRLATTGDLDLILPVHAQMAFEESGVDPLDQDPIGFRDRCARRIKQGRTWVWIECGELVFKADVVSQTPDVSYLEGVWVSPESRSEGLGLRCLSQITRTLLMKAPSVCVFVNGENLAAQNFYERAGFKSRAVYDTVFLNLSAAVPLYYS
jgi:ribosomal protein S18 acetylase RimI-like enzyme